MAGHLFAVLAVEAFEDGRDKKMVEWCKRCGVVRVTWAPRWDPPTYLIVGDIEFLQGGSRWGRPTSPACETSSTSEALP